MPGATGTARVGALKERVRARERVRAMTTPSKAARNWVRAALKGPSTSSNWEGGTDDRRSRCSRCQTRRNSTQSPHHRRHSRHPGRTNRESCHPCSRQTERGCQPGWAAAAAVVTATAQSEGRSRCNRNRTHRMRTRSQPHRHRNRHLPSRRMRSRGRNTVRCCRPPVHRHSQQVMGARMTTPTECVDRNRCNRNRTHRM